MALGPGGAQDGFSQDGESITSNGLPQSGIINDITGLIGAVANGVTSTYRAVANPNAPPPGSPTVSFSASNVSGLIVPVLLILGIWLAVEHLS